LIKVVHGKDAPALYYFIIKVLARSRTFSTGHSITPFYDTLIEISNLIFPIPQVLSYTLRPAISPSHALSYPKKDEYTVKPNLGSGHAKYLKNKPNLGSGHAKYLKNWKKSFKNSRFLVLNIPFWVQNCRSKDFFEI
jgi:phytoene dehydrogenase-like protein